jgi:hypothetical protein
VFVASTRTTLLISWDLLVGAETGGSVDHPLEITNYNIFYDDGLGG